jgi:hypothetical protein
VRNGWVHQTKSMNIRKKAHEQLDYDRRHEAELRATILLRESP